MRSFGPSIRSRAAPAPSVSTTWCVSRMCSRPRWITCAPAVGCDAGSLEDQIACGRDSRDPVRAARDGTEVVDIRCRAVADGCGTRSNGGVEKEDDLSDLNFQLNWFISTASTTTTRPPLLPSADVLFIKLKPKLSLDAKANEAALLLRESTDLVDAGKMRRIGSVAADRTRPGRGLSDWEIELTTDKDEAAIREGFESSPGIVTSTLKYPAPTRI